MEHRQCTSNVLLHLFLFVASVSLSSKDSGPEVFTNGIVTTPFSQQQGENYDANDKRIVIQTWYAANTWERRNLPWRNITVMGESLPVVNVNTLLVSPINGELRWAN
jgi:hypothetical protein